MDSPKPTDDVEFDVVWLDETGADLPGGRDEALAGGDRPRHRRAWAAALVVLGALVAGVLVHRAGSSPSPRAAAPRPAHTSGTAEDQPQDDQILALGNGQTVYLHDGMVIGPMHGTAAASRPPAALDLPGGDLLGYVESGAPCPDQSRCEFVDPATPSAVRAVHAALPHAGAIRAASVAQYSVLVLLALRVQVPGAAVEIVVDAADTGDVPGDGTLRGGRIRYVRAVLDGFSVDVQAYGAVPYAELRTLAYDPRLRR